VAGIELELPGVAVINPSVKVANSHYQGKSTKSRAC
jgi:hypothetical protein